MTDTSQSPQRALRFAATCPKGVESLLAQELRDLGCGEVRESRAAVSFEGPLVDGYRACLWSRLASRVLLQLAEFDVGSAEDLYVGVAAIDWSAHVSPDGTLAVDAVGSAPGVTHSGFAARKVKDAVVDRIRDAAGRRPSVDLDDPDVRLNLRLHRDRGTLSLDLAGQPLHRRGYRLEGEQVEAPLKENLAAALLARAGWAAIAARGGSLLDPMCGSGTLLIEGALMAFGRAPGLLRQRWGFERWLGHDEAAWHELLDDADARAEAAASRTTPLIAGRDSDPAAVEFARGCVRRAGLGDGVRVEVADVAAFEPPAGAETGLVITNPPYGVRLGRGSDLEALYATLGGRLATGFDGWTAAVFTSEPGLARATGLRSRKSYTFYNGAVETGLYLFDVSPSSTRSEVRRAEPAPDAAATADSAIAAALASDAGAEPFANRLRKNVKHLGKWARRTGVTCYRVYDADLPDYSVAIDLYQGAGPDEGRRMLHVQEYAPPPEIDEDKAARRLDAALAIAADALEVSSADVAVKVRRRQRGDAQYERQGARGEFVEVAEGGLRFYVNLHDYLDTGLFLDHRMTRARVGELAEGKRFLNLFAYTGTASVYAAAAGAASTTTVDMSATYTDWARRNLALNGFEESSSCRFVQADALAWIAEKRRGVEAGAKPYDLVFVDPPTFSNSARMGEATWDVQRDHVWLLETVGAVLAPGGTILFSTNARRFKLDAESLDTFDIRDITASTIPEDFARNPRVHSCFVLSPR